MRKADKRGADRRGGGLWAEEIGYATDAAPMRRSLDLPQQQTSVIGFPVTPFVPVTVVFDDGAVEVVTPLNSTIVGGARRVVQVIE